MPDMTRARAFLTCTEALEQCTPEDRDAVTRALRALYTPTPPDLFGDELVDAEPLGYIPGGRWRGRRVRP